MGQSGSGGPGAAAAPGAEPSSGIVGLDSVRARRGVVAVNSRYHIDKALESEYTIEEKVLGSGCSGPVQMAKNREGTKFAVKSFKKKQLNKEKRAELKNEVEIYLALDHAYIARLEDVFETADDIYLVMELMEGGELYARLSARKQYTEDSAASTARQMLLAVFYLHSSRIVHRDLKLENFLYESKETDNLKLIDFGFAKYIDSKKKMTQSCGSLHYVAPEVLASKYDEKCDMWSLGVIVFMLLTGSPPFFGTDPQVLEKIKKGQIHYGRRWAPLSEPSKEFCQRLMAFDPAERISAGSALEHPWIVSAGGDGTEVPVAPGVVRGLWKFAHASHFRRACLSMMAWSLPSEDRQYLKEQFDLLDLNHDGTITMKELQTVLADNFHIGVAETESLFHSIDANGDLQICYSEFMAATLRHRVRMHEDVIRKAFHRFDVDESGYVTLDNLRSILGDSFEGESVAKLLEEADTSGDGQISYEEFLDYLQDHGGEEGESELDGLGLGGGDPDDLIPEEGAMHVLMPHTGTHGRTGPEKMRHMEVAAGLVDRCLEGDGHSGRPQPSMKSKEKRAPAAAS